MLPVPTNSISSVHFIYKHTGTGAKESRETHFGFLKSYCSKAQVAQGYTIQYLVFYHAVISVRLRDCLCNIYIYPNINYKRMQLAALFVRRNCTFLKYTRGENTSIVLRKNTQNYTNVGLLVQKYLFTRSSKAVVLPVKVAHCNSLLGLFLQYSCERQLSQKKKKVKHLKIEHVYIYI